MPPPGRAAAASTADIAGTAGFTAPEAAIEVAAAAEVGKEGGGGGGGSGGDECDAPLPLLDDADLDGKCRGDGAAPAIDTLLALLPLLFDDPVVDVTAAVAVADTVATGTVLDEQDDGSSFRPAVGPTVVGATDGILDVAAAAAAAGAAAEVLARAEQAGRDF